MVVHPQFAAWDVAFSKWKKLKDFHDELSQKYQDDSSAMVECKAMMNAAKADYEQVFKKL